MDIFLLIIGFLLIIIGLAGSLLPVLPGPLASWVGLLLLYLTKTISTDWTFLGVTFVIVILITIIDNFIPAIGTKKFGGSKSGMIGTTIGLIVGLLSPIPGGIIIGPFLGAFIGEMLNKNNSKTAFKAAIGSFLGFLASTFIKFIVSVIYLGIYISNLWQFKHDLFTF